MINVIAAVAANRAIGNGNKLLYWLPDDLKRFKALTTGHTIIMGRRTFESLPKGALPNRRNVVLSRTTTAFPGCDTYASLDEALASVGENEDVYIIGGARGGGNDLAFGTGNDKFGGKLHFDVEEDANSTLIAGTGVAVGNFLPNGQ